MKTATSIIIAAALIGGAILFARGPSKAENPAPQNQNNVSVENGKQVIEITAKGGYLPRNTTAKANVPTVIKVNTNGTFDCSSALTIPKLGYRAYLPTSGETLIEVPPQKEGAVIKGICSMGMYSFSVKFN